MNEKKLWDIVKDWEAEVFVVIGWYHMIPKKWMDFAPVFGMHASLLPDYSGGAPLVWAIINGEKKTGITLFKIDEGVDSGPILDQLEVDITNQDTIKTLYEKVEVAGLLLLERNLSKIP